MTARGNELRAIYRQDCDRCDRTAHDKEWLSFPQCLTRFQVRHQWPGAADAQRSGRRYMKSRVLGLLLATTGSLLLAGCLQGTVHERNTSFSLYAHSRLGVEGTQDFLTSRTARLFSAKDLTLASSGINPSVFSLQTSNSTIVVGCAAAVDQRGYFLTVAHAVGQQPPWLVFGTGTNSWAKRARIVWRGEVSKGEPDLELLCAPCALHISAQETKYSRWDWITDPRRGLSSCAWLAASRSAKSLQTTEQLLVRFCIPHHCAAEIAVGRWSIGMDASSALT